MKLKICALLLLAALLATDVSLAVELYVETSAAFHIEAGDATETLGEFSSQSGLQLLFDYNQVHGERTAGVWDDLPPREALSVILAGTDLVFEVINRQTIAVTRRKFK
jgi:hypothetical protein